MNLIQSLFPVTLPVQWQASVPASLNCYLVDWLLHQGSLTARLQQHCQHFRVEVLGQQIENCDVSEACAMIKAGEQVLVREVLLYCDDQPQVFARSLLPLSSLTGEQATLASLGEQPLGAVIFNNASLTRQFIEVANFSEKSPLGKLTESLKLPFLHELWGRRSLFILEGKPLLVAEVFLPQSFAYQQGG